MSYCSAKQKGDRVCVYVYIGMRAAADFSLDPEDARHELRAFYCKISLAACARHDFMRAS